MKNEGYGIVLILIVILLAGCENPKPILSMETTSSVCPTLVTAEKQLCLEFHGDMVVAGIEQPIHLLYYQTEDYQFQCELTIGQEKIEFPLRGDFMASTVHNGFEIWDVNQDGYDDILIDHGIYGQIKIASCYVYTPEGFQAVSGFEALSTPSWSETASVVIEQWSSMPNNGVNRYRVEETELILEESLLCQHIAECQGGPWYTVKRRVDGELVVVQENVLESEIDLEYWYH